MFDQYVKEIQSIMARGTDQEATALSLFQSFMLSYQSDITLSSIEQSPAFPFPHWQIRQQDQLIGYIDRVSPAINLNEWEQLPAFQRLRLNFDNLLLLNFHEFRLYRHGEILLQAKIPWSLFDTLEDNVNTASQQLELLFADFFHFRLEVAPSFQSLALESAKRARLLSEWIQSILDDVRQTTNAIIPIYQTIQVNINPSLTKKQFADQYAQAFILYSLQPKAFASPVLSTTNKFNEMAATWWPSIIQSFQNPLSHPLQIVRDEIKYLNDSDSLMRWWNKSRSAYNSENPVLDFYKEFHNAFEPTVLFRRGIDETTYPLANYIARAVHQLLKTQLSCQNGLADEQIRVIHPASSLCTLMIEMMKLAAKSYIDHYGARDENQLFEKHIQPHFIALEHRLDFFAWGALNDYLAATSTPFVTTDQPFQHLFLSLLIQETNMWINTPVSSESDDTQDRTQPVVRKPLPVIICNTFHLQDASLFREQITSLIQESQPGLPGFSEVEGKRFPLLLSSSLPDPKIAMIRITQIHMVHQGEGISALIVPQKILYHPDYRGVRASLYQTMNEIYILNLHGSSLHNEHVPDGSQDENVFDEEQGIAVLFFVKRKHLTECKVYHADLLGARRVKDNWLKYTDFELYDYQPIKPKVPRFIFSPYDLHAKQSYQSWKSIAEIMPLHHSVPNIDESAWIDRDKTKLIQRLLLNNQQKQSHFIRPGSMQSIEKDAFTLEKEIVPFTLKPFEQQFIYLPEMTISANYQQIMQYFIHQNPSLVISQSTSRGNGEMIFSCFATTHFIAHPFLSTHPSAEEYLFPLHIFGTTESENKQPYQESLSLFEPEEIYLPSSYNIDKYLLKQLAIGYGRKVDAETLFHYIYAILWSNHYRELATQYQINSLPRIPFPTDRLIFDQIALKGQLLIALHVQQFFLSNNERTPRFYAITDNRQIEASHYNEEEERVYINTTSYIAPITPFQWLFAIGDHPVLSHLLANADTMDDVTEHQFCTIAMIITDTIKLIAQIDGLFDETIAATINFNVS
jgi:predicted helicase